MYLLAIVVTKGSNSSTRRGLLLRLRRFLQKPWHEKVRWVGLQWLETISRIPRPVRLPFGAYFFRWNDALGFNFPSFKSRSVESQSVVPPEEISSKRQADRSGYSRNRLKPL